MTDADSWWRQEIVVFWEQRIARVHKAVWESSAFTMPEKFYFSGMCQTARKRQTPPPEDQ